MPEKTDDLITFLEGRCAEIARLEAAAQDALYKQNNEELYRGKMRERTTMLSNLAQDAQKLLQALPEALREGAQNTLANFSRNASQALGLDSIFYMSALLYPAEHRPGGPNDLETFTATLKSALKDGRP